MDNGKSEYVNTPIPDNYELKWHKFLVYFALWAGGILNIINGARYMTGMVYGSDAKAVYNYFSGLKTLDVVMGLLCIALGVYAIIVRFQLAGFKTGAPKKLVSLYLISAAINLVYVLAASGVTGLSLSDLMDGSFFGNVIGSIAYALINKNYYDKRAALFVN
ncbi:MAG: hypothetical protein IKQ41_04000 [Clostridia bacterium]|nr:hypothetical protein [Clostridia bacterium]